MSGGDEALKDINFFKNENNKNKNEIILKNENDENEKIKLLKNEN